MHALHAYLLSQRRLNSITQCLCLPPASGERSLRPIRPPIPMSEGVQNLADNDTGSLSLAHAEHVDFMLAISCSCEFVAICVHVTVCAEDGGAGRDDDTHMDEGGQGAEDGPQPPASEYQFLGQHDQHRKGDTQVSQTHSHRYVHRSIADLLLFGCWRVRTCLMSLLSAACRI